SRTKRWVDAAGALILLLLLAPVLLAIALLIKWHSPGPVFFVQQRTGYRGRRFGMIKFRTMVANAEALKESLRHLNKHGANSVALPADTGPGVTPVARGLRQTGRAELPNLSHVVRGDMRQVGPRPASFNASRYHRHHQAHVAEHHVDQVGQLERLVWR